jgi:hypothetical protein
MEVRVLVRLPEQYTSKQSIHIKMELTEITSDTGNALGCSTHNSGTFLNSLHSFGVLVSLLVSNDSV